MNTKSLLALCSDKFLFNAMKKLHEHGVKLTWMITADPDLLKDNTLKDVTFFSLYDFSYPECIFQLDAGGYILSKDIIRRYRDVETMYLDNSDRFSYFPVSVRMRKNCYYKLLAFWLNFFENNQPTAIFHQTTPHMGWDNILFAIAKRHGIKNIILSRTLITNRVVLSNDYILNEKVPSDYLAEYTKEDIIVRIDGELYSSLWEKSNWLKRYEESVAVFHEPTVIRKITGFFRINKSHTSLLFSKVYNQIKGLFERNASSALLFNSRYRNIFLHILRFLIYPRKVRKLKTFYLNNCTRVDPNQPFALFALHFQPERATQPLGEEFDNQLLAIQILSKSLPKDVVLYVKDHPYQFKPHDERKRHYRTLFDYEELLKLKNVRLLYPQENLHDLTKKALFVSTITGSIGWEALLKNTPAIVFGNPWYIGCNSCYKVSSLEECLEALRLIMAKNIDDVEKDLLKYVCFSQDKLIVSTNSDAFIKNTTQVEYDTMLNNLVNAIKRMMELP